MASKLGKLLTCDRCGKTVFLECTGEGETDGGYTRWNKFEAAPNGWKCHAEVGNLCPECNSSYKDLIKSFMNKEIITVTTTTTTSSATSGYVTNFANADSTNVDAQGKAWFAAGGSSSWPVKNDLTDSQINTRKD